METQHTPTPEMNYELPVHIAWDDFTNGHRLVDSTGAIVARVKAEDVELPAFIVRAVNSHGELLLRLREMAAAFHHNGNHGGYFKDCDSQVCDENREMIAKAEGR